MFRVIKQLQLYCQVHILYVFIWDKLEITITPWEKCACVHICMCMYLDRSVCMHAQRDKVKVGCINQLLSILLLFGIGSLTEQQAHWSARKQQGHSVSTSPVVGLQMRANVLASHWGPQASLESTLPPLEPSFQSQLCLENNCKTVLNPDHISQQLISRSRL